MSFEEEFPSLYIKNNDRGLYSENRIKKFCLDKERVKTIIEEIINWGNQERINNNIFRKSADDLNTDWIDKLEDLKEELGLEK